MPRARILLADDHTAILNHVSDMLKDEYDVIGTVADGTSVCSEVKKLKPDLVVLDTRRAHLVPAGRILSAWIHNGQPSDIESSMVDGQFIMRNRKVLTMDEDRVIAEADTVGRRIWNKVLQGGPLPLPGRSRER